MEKSRLIITTANQTSMILTIIEVWFTDYEGNGFAAIAAKLLPT